MLRNAEAASLVGERVMLHSALAQARKIPSGLVLVMFSLLARLTGRLDSRPHSHLARDDGETAGCFFCLSLPVRPNVGFCPTTLGQRTIRM